MPVNLIGPMTARETPRYSLRPQEAFEYLTEFFQDCDTGYSHDGTTRWYWVLERLREILAGPHPQPHALPIAFCRIIRGLMDPNDATNKGPDRVRWPF